MTNEEKILEMLAGMKEEISGMKEEITGMKDEISGMKDEISGMKAVQEQQGKLLKEIDQRSARTQTLLESDYHNKLQLLYDGHALMMEKLDELAPKSRVELLEDDVAMLKDVIKLMRQEISELKQAQ